MPLDVGADNSSKVQLALDMSLPGGKVRLAPGYYRENIVIRRKTELIGVGSGITGPVGSGLEGPATGGREGDRESMVTIIEGTGVGSVIMVGPEGGMTWIRDLVVKGSGPGDRDAGIRILADGVNVEKVLSEGNTIGLIIEKGLGSNATDCLFRNNRGGILLSGVLGSIIDRCSIQGNEREGIDIERSQRSGILNSAIKENGLGILVRDGTTNCSANRNRVIGNRDFAARVVNNGETSFDARRNFWGRDTGPFHEKKNPRFRKDGPGGNITDLVEFAPWIDEEGREINSQDDLTIEEWGDGEGEDEKTWWDIPGFSPMMTIVSIGVGGVWGMVTSNTEGRRKKF